MKWAPVLGFEGQYEVSENGDVRSLPRYVKTRGTGMRLVEPRLLAQTPCDKQHPKLLKVTLSHGVKGEQSFPKVHRLVAESFLGATPVDRVVHWDGDARNNAVTNLRIVRPE